MNRLIVKILKILTYLPILFIFKTKRIFNIKSENNKVLVIALSRLGDTVFISFAISVLYQKYREKLTVLCYRNSELILRAQLPHLNCLSINNEDVFKGRLVNKNVLKDINEINPEKIYDLTGSILGAFILFYSNAKDILGFNEKYFSFLYTKFSSINKESHLIDLYLKPLKNDLQNIKVNKEFKINYNPEDKILIFPFGGWKAKEWNIEKFIQIQKELSKNYECKFIMEKKSFASKVFEINNVILTDNIQKLLEELNKCSLIISNDSGPLYIANMFGKPTFSIYGPTNPNYSLPYGKYHRYIQSNVHCIPKENNQYCYKDAGRKGCKKFICMDELSIEEVYSKIINFIEYLKVNNKKEVVG
ncbi:MAG: glycosyltransferase family 9 protein [Syntrophothermus sp.]